MENIPDQLIYSTYGNPQFSQLVYGIISPPMETNKCTFRIGKRPFGNHMWSATCKDKPWSNFLNWWFPGISGMAKVWKVWKVAPTQKESTMHYRIHQIRTCPKMQHHCVFWSVENLQKQHDIHTPFNLIIGTSRFAATFLLVLYAWRHHKLHSMLVMFLCSSYYLLCGESGDCTMWKREIMI